MLNSLIKVLGTISSAGLSLILGDSNNTQEKYDEFSDGLGLHNVSGEIMSKDEIEAEDYETGLYDDY